LENTHSYLLFGKCEPSDVIQKLVALSSVDNRHPGVNAVGEILSITNGAYNVRVLLANKAVATYELFACKTLKPVTETFVVVFRIKVGG
jgi:hypothetical protein